MPITEEVDRGRQTLIDEAVRGLFLAVMMLLLLLLLLSTASALVAVDEVVAVETGWLVPLFTLV